MNINERIIKITGNANVSNDLQLGDEVNVLVTGQVVKVAHLDNQDGTENIRFVVKASAMEVREDIRDIIWRINRGEKLCVSKHAPQ